MTEKTIYPSNCTATHGWHTKSVLIIGIGSGQIKLIQCEPQPAPPDCFESFAADVDTLLERLEQRLSGYMQ